MLNRFFPWLTITITVFLFSYCAQAQFSHEFLRLPPYSVATVHNALSPITNPAGLGVKNGSSLYIITPNSKNNNFADWGIAARTNGFGFIGEYKRIEVNHNRDRNSIGFGFEHHGVYLGTSYSWTKGLDRQNSWDAGMIFQPLQFISLGIVVKGFNQPAVRDREITSIRTKSDVGWDIGVALRPLAFFGPPGKRKGNRLTISLDAQLRRDRLSGLRQFPRAVNSDGQAAIDEYADNINYKFLAQFEVISGIFGWLEVSPELGAGAFSHPEQISAGIALNFGHAEIGRRQEQGTGRGVSWISVSSRYHQTVLKDKLDKFVEIKLSGALLEYQRTTSIFRPEQRTVYQLLRKIERYGNDPDVAGILLRIDGFSAGWAKLQEIRNALLEFQYTGKSVVVYFETCGNGSYYLASVADHIFIHPLGELGLTGLTAHSTYIRNTLDMLGLDPQYVHAGKYKSASNMYTKTRMSEAEKEELNYILDNLFEQFIADITEGRGFIADQVRDLIDDGPFNAEDAYSAGLVDELVQEDELETILKEYYSDDVFLIPEKKHDRRRIMRDDWEDLRTKSVAVVYGSGPIVRGEGSSGGLFTGETMGGASLARSIKKAREDKSIAAIVLRIDSPGGSMLASEKILREVRLCTQGEERKPLIVSMSDVAGSGGYYIACMADSVLALEGTITGSIGVISGKMSYQRLQGKLGINTETLTRGKHAGMWGEHRSFTDEEWDKLSKDIDKSYQTFIDRVAEGREMDIADVRKVAEGRIWTGSQAAENGLIDMTGGLDLAIQIAAFAGGIKDGEIFGVQMYPRDPEFNLSEEFVGITMRTLPKSVRKMLMALSEKEYWEPGEPLLLMPYRIDIE